MKKLTQKRVTQAIIAAALIIWMSYLLYDSLYELLVFRLSIQDNQMVYSLNIPTITHLMILVASVFGCISAILIVKYSIKEPEKRMFRHWIFVIICLIVIKISWCVWANDFFNSAFDVG